MLTTPKSEEESEYWNEERERQTELCGEGHSTRDQEIRPPVEGCSQSAGEGRGRKHKLTGQMNNGNLYLDQSGHDRLYTNKNMLVEMKGQKMVKQGSGGGERDGIRSMGKSSIRTKKRLNFSESK